MLALGVVMAISTVGAAAAGSLWAVLCAASAGAMVYTG
jgi:hypothetical protein